MTDFAINPRVDGLELLDFSTLFGNDRPVVLEIGSGKGRFLVSTAEARPDQNFIGIEKSLHYHRVIAERVQRHGLMNVRLINHDAFVVMQKMFADRSLAEVHIYFPDPWPRPRERKRRMIREESLAEIRRALRDDGAGIFVTDHREYFLKSVPLIAAYFDVETRTPGPDDPPRTNYEAKYREEGRPIYEARFRKKQ
jgi:tRNA (guanine-N7-)-methyltransferase